MKNILTKMGYMVIGCLLTLIGYHFGNVENNIVGAQQSSESVAPDIVGKLRVRQLEIVGNDNTSRIILGTNLDGAEIKFVGEDNTPRMRFVNKPDVAGIEIADPSGGKTTIGGKSMLIIGPNGNPVVSLMVLERMGYVGVRGKSNESLETAVFMSVNDEGIPGVVADFGKEFHQPTWTPTDDNKQSVIYEEQSIRTKRVKSIDFDRYKVAPGNTFRGPR